MSRGTQDNFMLAIAVFALTAATLICSSAGWAGVAAYQLDGGTSCPAHITYWLSGDATSVTIEVIDATTSAVVYTFPTITGAEASKGFHSGVLTWGGEADGGGGAPSGSYKLRATVVAPGTGSNTTKMAPIWESVLADGSNGGWRVYGIAMNNNPNSELYGRVYVGNIQVDGGQPKGVWEFNPDGSLIGMLPDPGFVGSGPWGICVDADDHIYVSNRSAPAGVWRYSWNGSGWTVGPKITGTTSDRYLSCSLQSGGSLRLIDTYADPVGDSCLSRIYAGTGDPPGSFSLVGSMSTTYNVSPYTMSYRDRFYQAAIDTDGTVFMSSANQVYNTPGPAKGALSKWTMSGTLLAHNFNLTQISGVALTPDGQTLWLARPVGPDGGSSSYYLDPDDPDSPADKCIYRLPKSDAMTAVAYPTPSASLTKYGLQTAYVSGTMKMPRFITADGSHNLAIAGIDHFMDSAGTFFGLYKEPTGTTPSTEVRVGRNTMSMDQRLLPGVYERIGRSQPGLMRRIGGRDDHRSRREQRAGRRE